MLINVYYFAGFGGFSEHPKFPQPVNLHFLMDWAMKNPNDPTRFSVIKMVETTLKEMAKGGIHDHIGQVYFATFLKNQQLDLFFGLFRGLHDTRLIKSGLFPILRKCCTIKLN